jgi:Mg/Co/Ni transporter MgtE
MDNVQPTNEEIRSRLLNDLTIEHLTKEEQDDIITQMSALLIDRITLALLSKLPKDELDRVNTLLQAHQDTAVRATLLKYIPDPDTIIERIIAETISEYHTLNENTTITTGNIIKP